MQAAMLRGAAFGGAAARPCVRPSTSGRATLVIRAAQPLNGVVMSVKTKQTVVVVVERLVVDAKYGKRIRKTKRYVVHDEDSKCNLGDAVRMEATRPLSALKRFRIAEITRSGQE